MQQHSGSVSEGLLGPSRQGPGELFSSMGHGATETAVQKVLLELSKCSVLFDAKF